MLEDSLLFVRKNMKVKTIIDPETGNREDKPEYPITAVREILINALLHRDYSIHTEGMPVQLTMYTDRIEVRNPDCQKNDEGARSPGAGIFRQTGQLCRDAV